jgi:2-amino-4-hydroxy-6-hydroxymethyldihydropteridine diphosphokinase
MFSADGQAEDVARFPTLSGESPRRIVQRRVVQQRSREYNCSDAMLQIAYLSLGSNIGRRELRLREAISCIGAAGSVVAVSSFYETEPVEFTEQAWFLNCAVALETSQSPLELMKTALQIEREMGRVRDQKKGPRTIDIDILLFGDSVIDSPELTIPHPAMQHRRFVLEPLAEIAPEARHPVLKKSVRELLEEVPTGQAVRKT